MSATPSPHASPRGERRPPFWLLIGLCQAGVASFGRHPRTSEPDEVEFTFRWSPKRLDLVASRGPS